MRHAMIIAALAGASAPVIASQDVIVANIPSALHWTVNGPVDGRRAYTFGVLFCNQGDQPAPWMTGTSNNAISASGIFRIAEGRIEQIGVSWVLHEFFALSQGNVCGVCIPTNGSMLGVGCASPTTANTEGSQAMLRPRSEVDAATGFFPPAGSGGGLPPAENALDRRISVLESDIVPGDPLYFAEMQVVHPGDAAAGVNNNDNTYRPIVFNPLYGVIFNGAAAIETPVVYAWRDHGNGFNQPDPSIVISPIDVPNDGRIYVASRATPLGAGAWRYDYAIQNVTSHRSVSGFSVQMGEDPQPTDFYFNDVDYDGEPFDNTDWTLLVGDATIFWFSPQTFDENPDTNALRWGTMYTFSFVADANPRDGFVSLTLFRPGDPTHVGAAARVPGEYCPTDLNLDGATGFADLNLLLDRYGETGVQAAEDVSGDNNVDFADLNLLLGEFGLDC